MANTCLDRNRLRDYLQGRLAEDESGSIAEHLESCNRCEELADKVEHDSDWLMNHLSVAATQPEPGPNPSWLPAVKRAVDNQAGNEPPAEPIADRVLVLGAYEIKELIGRGGMGYVYRAIHRKLGKAVALKVVAAPSAPAAGPRFEREMRAIGTLNHPAIVQATDADSSGERAYLVMELVDGIDLRTLTQRSGPLPPADACELIRQAADGLQQAHEAGVVHRDLKPSNLMLTREGQVKILDFGLAQMREGLAAASLTTSLGHVIGTIDYLAPEQTDGSSVDARADVYGLGATLFTLLAGRPPFGRSADTPLLTHLRRLATEDAPRLNEFRQDVPQRLTDLLADMLCRDPGDRPQTAADVRQRLSDILERLADGQDGGAATRPALERLAEAAMPEVTEPAESDQERQMEAARSLDDLNHHGTIIWGGSEPDTRVPRPVAPRRRSFRGVWTAAALLLGTALGGWLGVTIVLNTGEGQLRIESQVDDVQVSVLKHSETQLSVELRKDSQDVTLRAGVYEVRVTHPVDTVRLSQRQVRVLRGETAVVTVTREDEELEEKLGIVQEARPSSDFQRLPEVAEAMQMMGVAQQDTSLAGRLKQLAAPPTWNDRRPHEWLETLQTDRQPERQQEAIAAILGLVKDLPAGLSAELLLIAGAQTVQEFVGNNPDNLAAVVAAEPALWADDSRATDPILRQLGKVLAASSPLAKQCPDAVELLASLPLESVAAACANVDTHSGLAARAILLRSVLRHGLTTAPNALEAEQARSLLLGGRGHLPNEGAVRTDPLACLVIDTLDERQAEYLQHLFGRSDFATNSALAAIALRLTRRAPQSFAGSSRGSVFVRAIAYDQFGLAGPLYESRRARPDVTILSDTFADEMIPVLQTALERPGFVSTMMVDGTTPLDLFFTECYKKLPSVDSKLRATTTLCERVFERLVAWRNAARLEEELRPGDALRQYLIVGKRFQQVSELLVAIKAQLPSGLRAPTDGTGDLSKQLAEWQTPAANSLSFQSPAVILLSWYPYEFMRPAFDGRDHSGLGIVTPGFNQSEDQLPQAIWLAVAADSVEDGRANEILLTNAFERRRQVISETAARHQGLNTLLRRICVAAKTDQLCAAAISVSKKSLLLKTAVVRRRLGTLMLSEHLPIAMQAMRWLGNPTNWHSDEYQQRAAERLARPGFADLAKITTAEYDPAAADYLYERLVLLEHISTFFTFEVSEQIVREMQKWLESAEQPIDEDRLEHTAESFSGVVRGHPFTPALRLIRLVNVAKSIAPQLDAITERLERQQHFRGQSGLELRAALEQVRRAAEGMLTADGEDGVP